VRVVQAQVRQRPCSLRLHASGDAGRQQRNQRGDAAALAHAVLVLGVLNAQALQQRSDLLVHSSRAAGR